MAHVNAVLPRHCPTMNYMIHTVFTSKVSTFPNHRGKTTAKLASTPGPSAMTAQCSRYFVWLRVVVLTLAVPFLVVSNIFNNVVHRRFQAGTLRQDVPCWISCGVNG
jgi:hypothetical protein